MPVTEIFNRNWSPFFYSISDATSGSASDWVYDVVGCKYSFSIELRDRGVFGFLLPRTEIIPTAEETWNGILAVVSYLQEKNTKATQTTPEPEPSTTTQSWTRFASKFTSF